MLEEVANDFADDFVVHRDTHRICRRPQFAAMLLSLFALTVTTAQIAPCADDACIRRALSALSLIHI